MALKPSVLTDSDQTRSSLDSAVDRLLAEIAKCREWTAALREANSRGN